MEFSEVIRRGRMVHAFTAEPLAPGTAERLLRAANRAPSAGFSQGYSLLVLEGKEEARADRDEARMPIPYWYIDTGFTALLMLLAAVDEELGAVFFGPPDIADVRAWFGVPDEWTPIGAIAVGHPDLPADPVPPARASDRKSLDELVHRGQW
jgi:nitroreductase